MNTKILDSIRVEQMVNYQNNYASNQFIIRTNGCIMFQSYDSPIVSVDYDKRVITFYPKWDYSNTTHKHRNIFFRNYVKIDELSNVEGCRKYLKEGKIRDWKIKRK